MAQTTRAQFYQLATKSKHYTIEENDHDDSFSVVKRHPKTNKILEGYRCFVSGHCLDLVGGSSIPCSPHEAAEHLKLV